MAKIKRVIYLMEAVFCRRDYDRFGIETVTASGFNVEVWDITPALHPDVYRNVQVKDPVDFHGYRLFNTRQDAVDAIEQLDDSSFIVSIVFYDFNSYPIFKAISKKGIRYSLSVTNALPLTNELVLPKISRWLKGLTPRRVANSVFLRTPFEHFGVRPATLLVSGGRKNLELSAHFPVNKDTEVLWCHSFDYDVYLRERQAPSVADVKTGVFLDENICFHPDYLYRKHKQYTLPEKYFRLLRDLFNFLEKSYDLSITIAAHPRSRYEDHPDYFGGRPVIRWKTAELVKNSGFVIAHCTTSINFAVLFKKPIVFVTTNDLVNSPQGEVIDHLAFLFNKKPINLDESVYIDRDKELVVDNDVYDEYAEAFIKRRGTPDLPFWQIFADKLKAQT